MEMCVATDGNGYCLKSLQLIFMDLGLPFLLFIIEAKNVAFWQFPN